MRALLLFAAVFLSSCSFAPCVVKSTPDPEAPHKQREIFVVNHSWHTGFVVPSGELERELPQLKKRFGSAPCLEVGWGDKGFYQAQKITSGLALRAMFLPTGSVVHVVGMPEGFRQHFPFSKYRRLRLDARDYAALVAFIAGSFKKTERNEILPLGPGLYGDSQFCEGAGNYFVLNTCNNWTAKGLKSAGLHIFPGTKMRAQSIMGYLEKQDDHPGRSETIRGRAPRSDCPVPESH